MQINKIIQKNTFEVGELTEGQTFGTISSINENELKNNYYYFTETTCKFSIINERALNRMKQEDEELYEKARDYFATQHVLVNDSNLSFESSDQSSSVNYPSMKKIQKPVQSITGQKVQRIEQNILS